MKTEIFRINDDVAYLKRGNIEVEIVRAYDYNLLDRGGNSAGYRIQTTSGKTLQFVRFKGEAMKWAKEYLRRATK